MITSAGPRVGVGDRVGMTVGVGWGVEVGVGVGIAWGVGVGVGTRVGVGVREGLGRLMGVEVDSVGLKAAMVGTVVDIGGGVSGLEVPPQENINEATSAAMVNMSLRSGWLTIFLPGNRDVFKNMNAHRSDKVTLHIGLH